VPITGQTFAVLLAGAALGPTLIGDVLKAVLAAGLLPGAWRLLQQLLTRGANRRDR
jgi:biotin transporter BioY